MSCVPVLFRNHDHPCDTQLAPDSRWCKEHAEECAVLTPLIDLTGYERLGTAPMAQRLAHRQIGKKTFCTVGTERDHVECDEVIHTDDDGVFLVFEARGATNPLDSPSALFVTDVSEDGSVYLNGGELPKKIAVQVGLAIIITNASPHHHALGATRRRFAAWPTHSVPSPPKLSEPCVI